MNQLVEMTATIEAEFDFSNGYAELLSVYLFPDYGDPIEITKLVSETLEKKLTKQAEKKFENER